MPAQNINVTADSMVFSKGPEHLQLLLMKRKNDPFAGYWAIPGGFVDHNEELEAAAIRELQEETGLHIPAMKQLHTFGQIGRDPRGHTISVVHYAFTDAARTSVHGGDDAAEAKWVNVKDITELAFDHMEILAFALQQLELG